MKRTALTLVALSFALPAFAALADPPSAPTKSPVEIQSVAVSELTSAKAVFTLRWKYVEQESLARPKELSIIAILVGAHGAKLTGKLVVPVPASGPIPTSAAVAVPHDGALAAGQDVEVTVSVLPRIAGISDGTSNIVDGTSNTLTAKKTSSLRLP
jgi:hypothetical protein